MEISNIVESLEKQFDKLFVKIDNLSVEKKDLQSKLRMSDLKINELTLQLEKLNTHYQSIKVANALLGSEDYKRETKLKINTLIREIDYCVAQLSN